MSAPRIKVFADATGHDDVPCFVWYCNDGPELGPVCAGGETWTIDDAATEGMRHLAAHHTAQMPPVAHGDPDGLNVAPGPHTARPIGSCECGVSPDPGICPCAGPGKSHCMCIHDNPIQHTYDTSRSDS